MHDPDWNISNDEARRKSWALDIGKYFERREHFWLDKIAGLKEKTVVFVCGDAHVDTFGNRLKAAGWQVHVAAREIGITNEDRRNVAEGLQYLKEHPQILNEDWFSRIYPNAEQRNTSNDNPRNNTAHRRSGIARTPLIMKQTKGIELPASFVVTVSHAGAEILPTAPPENDTLNGCRSG
jgi:hypothetical protein